MLCPSWILHHGFSILLFTICMAVIPPKVLGHEFPNEPVLNTEKGKGIHTC